MQKLILSAVACLMLQGCGSKANEIETQYFVLGLSDNETTKPTPQSPIGHKIDLMQLTLADYLNEGGIAMIMPGNRINIANYALWGESLDTSIARALRFDLQAICYCDMVNQTETGQSRDNVAGLRIEIDRFGPTSQGYATLSGHYSITKTPNKDTDHHFDLRVDLKSDGYQNAVVQMRELVAMLAADIQSNMRSVSYGN